MSAGGHQTSFPLYTWLTSGKLDIHIGFSIDRLTAVMLLLVTTVSSLVHIYTIGYMHGEPGYARFFSYIALFTFSMLMLVMADNLLQLFVFWEAVGLCSYLLIGHWYERPAACAAATKAFIVNRVGDFGFMLGLLLVWYSFGSLDYHEIFARAHESAGDVDECPRAVRRDLGRLRAHTHLPSVVHRRSRQIGASPAPRLAAGCDGRPHADLGAHPCRDDGHGGRVHGRAIGSAV